MESTGARTAIIGVADHAGWAVLVTATADGGLLDRRQVALVDDQLPRLPYHHDAQGVPLAEAEALIARVEASARHHAAACLAAVAAAVPAPIAGVALRACPPLPATVAARLADYRAQNVADTVMMREALADAARARGWAVDWYQPRQVGGEAAGALGVASLDEWLAALGRAVGPPWRKDHRVAMAAALAAAARRPIAPGPR